MFRFTQPAWDWMAEQGVSAVCDLRSREERELAPTIWQGGKHTRHIGVEYDAQLLFAHRKEHRHAGLNEMHDSLYAVFPRLLAPSLKAMFQALLEARTPLVVHCSAGQDRTGFAVGVLLSLLGVARDTILADYHLSTRCRRIENELDLDKILAHAEHNAFARYYADVLRRRGQAALKPRELVNRNGQSLLLDAFHAIGAEWGSVPAYVEAQLGLRHEHIVRLRKICLTALDAQ